MKAWGVSMDSGYLLHIFLGLTPSRSLRMAGHFQKTQRAKSWMSANGEGRVLTTNQPGKVLPNYILPNWYFDICQSFSLLSWWGCSVPYLILLVNHMHLIHGHLVADSFVFFSIIIWERDIDEVNFPGPIFLQILEETDLCHTYGTESIVQHLQQDGWQIIKPHHPSFLSQGSHKTVKVTIKATDGNKESGFPFCNWILRCFFNEPLFNLRQVSA